MSDKCVIEFKRHGLEIKGPCAQGFINAFAGIYQASKEVNAEISAYACVNPKSGSVEKTVLGKIGTPTSTSLPFERVCPIDQRQISIHTHPMSGIAKFSETDAITITERINKGVDDASCVIGENESLCLSRVLIQKKNDLQS